MRILGINPGHDSSAALIVDGKIIADVAEERFSRQKNDSSFPHRAIDFCLKYGQTPSDELDLIALPISQIPDGVESRFVSESDHQVIHFRPAGLIASHIEGRILQKQSALPLYFSALPLSPACRFFLSGHHAAHAATAYYPSGVNQSRALVATLDGVGEEMAVGLWRGENGTLTPLYQCTSEGSLGWYYGNVTEALGWRHGGDEWKVMGLAPYGEARAGILTGFHPEYKDGKLVKGHDYGRFSTWSDHGALHFHFRDATRIAEISQRIGRENLAAEAQAVLEEQVLNLLPAWLEKERTSILLCAGGVFLNVKVNQRLWYTDLLSQHWIYPNPGDGGLAAGAGLLANALLNPGVPCERLTTASFGPDFSTNEIRNQLRDRGLPFREVGNPAEAAIPYLLDNRVVAWFQGRLESGPRALGNRSILMDPRHASNKDTINAKVKFREAFRPFCPSILADKASEYLVKARDERFMMTSFVVKEQYRSIMPAVTHVDNTTRPQFVYRQDQPLFYELIERFGLRTGIFALLNTSFNIKGEPIVCTPRDAIRTFFDTGIDVLIIDRFVLSKLHIA